MTSSGHMTNSSAQHSIWGSHTAKDLQARNICILMIDSWLKGEKASEGRVSGRSWGLRTLTMYTQFSNIYDHIWSPP